MYLILWVMAFRRAWHPDMVLIPDVIMCGRVWQRCRALGHRQPHQHSVVWGGDDSRHVGVGSTEARQGGQGHS